MPLARQHHWGSSSLRHHGEPDGVAVSGMVTHANGTAERRSSEIMLKAKSKAARRRITAGEDKAYDTANHGPRSGCREIIKPAPAKIIQ